MKLPDTQWAYLAGIVEGKNPELRKELWLQMKSLNRKGKTVETNTPNTSSPEVKIESELS